MDPWALTRELSVRDTIRVYTRTAGAYTNTTRETSMSKQPSGPWAMYLAWGNTYQYLVFDIDNHTNNPAQADKDAARLRELLDAHGIEHVVCSSSANGGYHIWIALLDSISAQLARDIALAARRVYPSVDPTCMLNPATGCVRPPLSPHWKKGASRILTGDLNALLEPRVSEQQILNLLDSLTSLSQALPANTTGEDKPAGQHVDQHGLPFIPGTLRPLSPAAMSAMNTPVSPTTDTSARLYQITLAAVRAHWTYSQYTDYINAHEQLPGLMHAFTRNNHGTRIPRDNKGANSMRSVIARMWRKAYTTITNGNTQFTGSDSEFLHRSQTTTHTIENLVAWNMTRHLTGTGQATDQRVLNTLSLFALQAHRLTIQADSRRIALTCGISRQAASTSLKRLMSQGLISLTRKAEGRQAHTYTIHTTKNSTNTRLTVSQRSNLDTSEYAPTPATLSTIRQSLLTMLTSWLQITSHDACTYQGIGIKNGNQLATQHLEKPLPASYLDKLAHRYNCVGTTAAREATYTLERALWAWWNQELSYLTSPAATQTGRRTTHPTDSASMLTLRRYPRTSGHSPDHGTAKQLLIAAAA